MDLEKIVIEQLRSILSVAVIDAEVAQAAATQIAALGTVIGRQPDPALDSEVVEMLTPLVAQTALLEESVQADVGGALHTLGSGLAHNGADDSEVRALVASMKEGAGGEEATYWYLRYEGSRCAASEVQSNFDQVLARCGADNERYVFIALDLVGRFPRSERALALGRLIETVGTLDLSGYVPVKLIERAAAVVTDTNGERQALTNLDAVAAIVLDDKSLCEHLASALSNVASQLSAPEPLARTSVVLKQLADKHPRTAKINSAVKQIEKLLAKLTAGVDEATARESPPRQTQAALEAAWRTLIDNYCQRYREEVLPKLQAEFGIEQVAEEGWHEAVAGQGAMTAKGMEKLEAQWGRLPLSYRAMLATLGPFRLWLDNEGDEPIEFAFLTPESLPASHEAYLSWLHTDWFDANVESGIDLRSLLPVAGEPTGATFVLVGESPAGGELAWIWRHDDEPRRIEEGATLLERFEQILNGARF